MFRKYFCVTFLAVALSASSAIVASAQTGQLRGHVKLKQADGTTVPAVGAIIDVLRLDIVGEYETKTDQKGEFLFARLPLGGTYIIGASLANTQPSYQGNVKVERDVDNEIEMSPGDGHRLSFDELKRFAKEGGPAGATKSDGGESAADKAKRAELDAKNREIEASIKKDEASNVIIARTFKAGNDAFTAGSEASKANNRDEAIKKFGEAIAQYDEGLAADPEQPAILTIKALALQARGVDRYNLAITTKDDAAKTSGLDGARGDFKAAAEATVKALDLLKAHPAGADPAAQSRFNANKLSALAVHAEAMRLYVTKGDPTQADAGLAAYHEYIAVEPDPAKKATAQMDAAQMLLDANAGDKAFAEFKKILDQKPNDPDANLGAGLALFSIGDKAKYQDAANYLQHFVDIAPDTHKFKADAVEILKELKNTENVVPEKTTPVRR